MDDVREIFAKMLAEVKKTEATHTRNAGTDYRCRQVFVEHGDAILAALTPASDGRAEALEAEVARLREAERTAWERVQHVKRGSTYKVLARGNVQTDTPLTDYAKVVVYQGEDDGLVWVRPVSEFEDGRFLSLTPETSHDWRGYSTKTEGGYNG